MKTVETLDREFILNSAKEIKEEQKELAKVRELGPNILNNTKKWQK